MVVHGVNGAVERGREREVTSCSSAARLLAHTDRVCWGNICCAEWERETNRGKAGEEVMGEGTTTPAGMQYSPNE